MDKETLSNYGWIVICVLVLSVMLALATPFGTFIADGFKATYTGLIEVEENALDIAGIVMVPNVVPDNYTYTTADGVVYGPGEKMPETVQTGDIYENDVYEFRYNQSASSFLPCTWNTISGQDGWGMHVKTTYFSKITAPEIPEYINGEPVTSLQNAFFATNYLYESPRIPSTVKNMYGAFANSHQLKKMPDLGHCTNLTNLEFSFAHCGNLKEYGTFPVSATTMDQMFLS